jgi:uncharacterized protein (TIGR00369 family)
MNKALNELSLNDFTDYGLCFVCGPKNECGLGLKFERTGDKVTTSYTPLDHHQGFPGLLHGGIISSLLDEVMSRVSVLEGKWTQTVKLEVRFRRPISLCQTVTAEAKKVGERRKLIQVEGIILLEDGSLAAEGKGMFAPVPDHVLSEMSANYPVLRDQWMVNKM